jgi:hypothetical protein
MVRETKLSEKSLAVRSRVRDEGGEVSEDGSLEEGHTCGEIDEETGHVDKGRDERC